MTGATCRFCRTKLDRVVVDLGWQPLANSFLTAVDLEDDEAHYPLCVYVCGNCLLVQIPEVIAPERIFSEYPYFSSYSDSWLRHVRDYVGMVVERFGMSQESQVVEVGSNDGYLLQYFVQRGVGVLGVEPAANVAAEAVRRGIPTLVKFFGRETARELVGRGVTADLIVANNVLAHVPDLNGFVAGWKILLKDRGIVTAEFPHLLRLVGENQFDTIYHEHFSYFSVLAVERVFAAHGLSLFDVEEIPTHGGSLRVFVSHAEAGRLPSVRVNTLKAREVEAGLDRLDRYREFADRVATVKAQLLSFLREAKRGSKVVVGYGAPAKGNTLLNYCGIGVDLVSYTVDRSPHKQGRYLPGSRIPVYHPDRIRETKPGFLLVLPWNIKDEVMEQMSYIRSWGGRFVVPIPQLRILQ